MGNQTRRLPRTLPPRLLQLQPRRRRPLLLKLPKKRLKKLLLKPRRLPKLPRRLTRLLPRLLPRPLLSLLLPRPAKDLRLSPPKDFRSSRRILLFCLVEAVILDRLPFYSFINNIIIKRFQ